MQDLTNKQFGRWTVLAFSHKQGKNYYWYCECSCELKTIKPVNTAHLNNGKSKSCGCLSREINTKHSLDGNKIYHVFNSMKARCYSKYNKSYKNYGGRGILICEEWLRDVRVFVNWAEENGYREGLTIERIDVNGNYSPENCTWVTRNDQMNNMRRNIFITFENQTKTLAQWARIINIKFETLYYRIVTAKWNVKDALTKPVGR